MPQSLDLGVSSERKRQRSRDSRKAGNGDGGGRKASTDTEKLARNGIRIPAYLSKTKSEITAAFQDLEWKQRSRLAAGLSNPDSPFKVAGSFATAVRNRYMNIQPWDNSRVRLKNPIGGSDYINASPIKLQSARKIRRTRSNSTASTAAAQEYSYIATQGPKDGQFSHFWHMVMQETPGPVGVIVMLTLCYEANKEKCGQYFPPDADHSVFLAPERIHMEPPKPPDDGDPFIDTSPSSAGTDSYSSGTTSSPLSEADAANNDDDSPPNEVEETDAGVVELVSIQNDASLGAEVRELRLTIGEQSKTIYHYLYSYWPDFGKPENEERAALMRLMKVSKQTAGESPRIVHCSAGVGRTGTFIALDFLTGELEAGRLVRRLAEAGSGSEDLTGRAQQSGKDNGSQSKSKQQATTPEIQQGEDGSSLERETDLIKDTVDLLRQQRMMMVMNELQFSLLYEVIRESFLAMYAEKGVGAVVTGAVEEAEGPSPKVARKSQDSAGAGDGDVYGGTKVGTVQGEEDTVSDLGGGQSEAETEIEGAENSQAQATGLTQNVKDQMQIDGEEDDPYAAVAPERIREGIRSEREERS